jgi:transcriptional regulator with XRE-family HTH domain
MGEKHMTFVGMLNEVLTPGRCGSLTAAAASIGISPQYLHDLKEGRRLPSVTVVNKICDWMGRGPKGRLEWHLAGAEAHGWEIRSVESAPSAEKPKRGWGADTNWQAAPFDGEEGP